MGKIFYIDPQSMINLAKYDYHLLRSIDMPVYYFCSKYYDANYAPAIYYKKVFSYNKLGNNGLKAISYICSWLMIMLYVIALRPKVVHIQWFRIPLFDLMMVRLLQGVFKIKVVFTAHNLLPHQGNESKNTHVFHKAYHAFSRIIVHSQLTKQELIEQFQVEADTIEVIRHGILPLAVDEKHYAACQALLDEKYASLKGKTVFSALGYQNYYKGTDLLASVWAETPELCLNQNVMLLIIGKVNENGMDLTMLEGIDNVICENKRIPDEEFLYLLRHTNVYLLPYREISQSGAMLTVLTEHVPLLLTDVGSLAEPLSVANIGWKMQRADKAELRQSLLYLIGHKAVIERIHNDHEAWEKVNAFYDWNAISRQTQQLYESLIQ